MPLSLDEASRFLDDELPRAGYRLRYRERSGHRFYAFYETKGYHGQVSVKPLCQARRRSRSRRARRCSDGPTRSEAYALTMKTGVPMRTWPKSHSASGIRMRMQPCEAE
jgi:hypothetical protein